VVMSSSLQCFWQVWLSSLPELNSLHSMQSLQKNTERERLSTEKRVGKRSFRVNHFHYKDGFVPEADSVKKQTAVGLETVCPLDVGSCISVTSKSPLRSRQKHGQVLMSRTPPPLQGVSQPLLYISQLPGPRNVQLSKSGLPAYRAKQH